MVESRVIDVVNAQDGIKRTAITLVTELDTLDVVWGRTGLPSDGKYVAERHIDEFRMWVDETADQPGAGDAVDLWMFPRDPFIWRLAKVPAGRQTLGGPSSESSFDISGLDARSAQ